MNFIIQYSICSLILYILVLLYNLRIRKLMNFQNNVFILFTALGMCSNLLDLCRCVISIKAISTSLMVITVFNELYYLYINVLPICFLMYCFALVNFFHIQNNIPRKFKFILIPFIISVVYILASPFFPDLEYRIFYVIEGTSLIQNGKIGYLFLFIEALCYIMGGFEVVWHYRKVLEKGVLGHMFLALNLMLGSMVAQFLFPYARVIPVAISMFVLDVSFYIQRSEDVYNNSLECLNKEGFRRFVNHLFIRHSNFTVFSIIMDDSEFYHTAIGEKDRGNLEICIINALKSNYKRKNFSVYKFKFGSYALISRQPVPDSAEEIISFIKNQIGLRWGFSALELDLSFRVCQIESQIDVKNYQELSDIIGYLESNKKLEGRILKAKDMDLIRVHSNSYLETAIVQGLREQRFEVYYQPIYSVKDNKLTGAEALIRLRDDEGNFVSPEEFIPVAEKNGTIFEIGTFVFTSVCETLSKLDLSEYSISKVDINLSVIQCIQEDMYEQLINIRNQYNIPSNLINIEITETASTNSPDILLRNMKYLEEDGIELSLDDYGSGNSNISYILNLPFKMIKIDKNIVWKSFENPNAKIVLQSTIDMIKELGLIVLAEGVETEEQANELKEMGCNCLQGYYYSRPLPVQKFLEIMKK